MAIRREVALTHRFSAPASEDLFFTMDLILDGLRCRHVDAARLRSRGRSWGSPSGQNALRGRPDGRGAYLRAPASAQCARRAGGQPHSRRPGPWQLRRSRSPHFSSSLRHCWRIAGAWPATAVFAGGLVALALTIVTGLVQARAHLRTWVALLAAPWYVVFKAIVQLRALAA